MNLVPAVVCALIGLVAGGMLEPLVQRTPIRMRRNLPAPHCDRCGTRMTANQKQPSLARLLNKNRCKQCQQRLWLKAPWLELTCAVVFAVIAGRFGWAWALPAYLLFAFSAIAITVIDCRHHLIPNRIVYPTLLTSLLLLTLASILGGNFDPLIRAVIGMLGAYAFFFIVWFVYPKGMGFGDVRLALLIGLFTGWMGIGNVFIGVLAGLLLGAVSGLAFVALRFAGLKDPIPYGPFLIAGAFVAIFFGQIFAPVLAP